MRQRLLNGKKLTGTEFFKTFAEIKIYPYFCIEFDTRYYADTV